MRWLLDLEANGLKPTKIWIIHGQDIDTGQETTFFPAKDGYEPFLSFASDVHAWIGHNILGYDLPVLYNLSGLKPVPCSDVCDTLILSRLLEFHREGGHSLDQYGKEQGIQKIEVNSWDEWNDLYIERCKTDVRINLGVFHRYEKYLHSDWWRQAIYLEHEKQVMCNELHSTGMFFDVPRARELLAEISGEVSALTTSLQEVFPPRSKLIREITPKETKHGTLSKVGLAWAGSDLTSFSSGAVFSRIYWEPFNPGSPTQRIDRLWEAGWKPTERTEGHKDFLKETRRRKLTNEEEERKKRFDRYGWKTSEENLSSLPAEAPVAARTLVRWLLLNSRRNKLEKEWLANVGEDGRIHGTYNGHGTWTGRCTHTNPNMGNIPSFNPKLPETTPYSDRLRSLFGSGPERYLVGVDAEGIQLRILAHYLNDEEYTHALVNGDKRKATDPHSINASVIGPTCQSRDDAKTFIYAWILDAGIGRVAEIFRCSYPEAKEAIQRVINRWPKMQWVKDKLVPADAGRGYFEGIDGRFIKIPGEDFETKAHYTLAGYLQSAEQIIMNTAWQIAKPALIQTRIPFRLVNYVYDEFQVEVPRDMDQALKVAKITADAIRLSGEKFSLRCPMSGSYINSHGDLAIGDNWSVTH